MTDKAQSGDDLNIAAAAWNNSVDAGDYYAHVKRLGEGTPSSHRTLPTDIVKVRNDTGGDRRAGEVMECDELLPTEKFENGYLWFEGVEPTGTEKFGILRKALPDGAIGELQVSGVCKALVDVADVDHAWAKVVSGSHVLDSANSGQYKILWSPGETGEQECVVVFSGRTNGPSLFTMGELVEDMCSHDTCAEVSCVTGSCDEEPQFACNPYHRAGQAGDRVFLVPVSLCGTGYDADGPAEGCEQSFPCDNNDCDAETNDATAKWVIIVVEAKCLKVTQQSQSIDNCLWNIQAQIAAEYCTTVTCNQFVTELEPVSSPSDTCEESPPCVTLEEDCCSGGGECCGWPEGGTPEVTATIDSTCSTIDGQTATLITTDANRNSGLYQKEPPGDPEFTLCGGSTELQIFWQCYYGTGGTLGGQVVPEPESSDPAYRYALYLAPFSATDCCEVFSAGVVYPYEANCATGVFKYHAGTLRVTESCEVAGIPAGPCGCYNDPGCDYGDHDIDIIITQETATCDGGALRAPTITMQRRLQAKERSQAGAKLATDIACVHRGEPTRTLEGCGCGTAPGVYACGIYGECVALLKSGKARKAIEASGLPVCETCAARQPD